MIILIVIYALALLGLAWSLSLWGEWKYQQAHDEDFASLLEHKLRMDALREK
jgi:hypothetical protein